MNSLCAIIFTCTIVLTSCRVIDATSESNGKDNNNNNDNNILMYSSDSSSVINDFQDWIPLPWIKLIADAGFRRKNAPPNDVSSHSFNTVHSDAEYRVNDERDNRVTPTSTPIMLPPYEFKRKLEAPVVKVKKISAQQSPFDRRSPNAVSLTPILPLTPPSLSTQYPAFSVSSVPPISPTAILLPRTPPPTQPHRSPPPQRSPPPAPYRGTVVSSTPQINNQQCTCSPAQKYSSRDPSTQLVKKHSRLDHADNYSPPRVSSKKLSNSKSVNDHEDGDDDDDGDEDYSPVILKGYTNAQLEIKCSQLFESKRRQSTGQSSPLHKQASPSSVNRATFKLSAPNARVYPRVSSSSSSHHPSTVPKNSLRKASSTLVRGRAMAPKSVSFTPRSSKQQSNWNPLIHRAPNIAKCR